MGIFGSFGLFDYHALLLKHLQVGGEGMLAIRNEQSADAIESVIVHESELDHLVLGPRNNWLIE